MSNSSKLEEICAQIQRRHAAILQKEDEIHETASAARTLMAKMKKTFDSVSTPNVKRLIGKINERQQVILF